MKTLGLCVMSMVFALLSEAKADSQSDTDAWLLKSRSELRASLNQWDIAGMMSARAEFERMLPAGLRPALVRYYIAYADYRIALYHLAQKDKKQSEFFLEDGLEHLETAETIRADFADALALRTAIYGIQIALSPITRGFTLGPRSGRVLGEAYTIDEQNPRVYLVDGNRLFRTPGIFGGGTEKALEKLHRAAELFEEESGLGPSVEPKWGHAEVFAMMGQVQMAEEDFDGAEASFSRALEIDPEYGWVKFALLPQLAEARRDSSD